MTSKMDGLKRVLSAGALALATTTVGLGVPKAHARVDVGVSLGAPAVVAAPPVVTPYATAAPPVVGLNLGVGGGHDHWHHDHRWHDHGHHRR
jgi:hypothetical protein